MSALLEEQDQTHIGRGELHTRGQTNSDARQSALAREDVQGHQQHQKDVDLAKEQGAVHRLIRRGAAQQEDSQQPDCRGKLEPALAQDQHNNREQGEGGAALPEEDQGGVGGFMLL